MGEPAAPGPGRVFISYRREETAYPAGWLYDRLVTRYGGQVFKDVDSIQLGDDFVEVITRAVGSCDVLLALIGDQWLTITGADGGRRLDDPDDFVRLEIEAALTRDVRVIPILVGGASLPRTEELPPSLAGLVRRQALELSPARFDFDTNRLVKVLDRTLAEMRTRQDGASAMPAGADAASGTAGQRATPETVEPDGPSTRPSSPAVLATGAPEGPARRRRLVSVGVGAVVLAIVATVATLLVQGRGDPTKEDGRTASSGTTPSSGVTASNEITSDQPWRLVIRSEEGGCTVTLTNTSTGDQEVFSDAWATKQFQIHSVGTFQWQADSAGCHAVRDSGTGSAVPPFTHRARTGDTDVFAAPRAPGRVAVEVVDFHQYGRCDFELRDAADGQRVAFGEVSPGEGPVRLDPGGRSRVYLADFAGCDIRVSVEP